MKRTVIITVLMLCFCHGPVFADQASTGQAASLDANTADTGTLGHIVQGIKKLDAWMQQNLW